MRRTREGSTATGRERRRLGPATLAFLVAAALLHAACDMEIIGGGGEVVDRFSLTVTVTNVGNGFGRAEVTFPSGTVRDPCDAILGPGESCSPSVVGPLKIQSAEIQVSAEDGSVFVGWSGAACTGTSSECTVADESGDRDAKIDVEPRFDLID